MGAAWYKTKQGVLEVWLLPKAETFASLQIVVQPQPNGRFIYSFQGAPHIQSPMDSSKPIAFLKHGNLTFEVRCDEELAENITQVLGWKPN